MFVSRRELWSLRWRRSELGRIAAVIAVVLVMFALGGCSRLGEPGMRIYLNQHGAELEQSASSYSRPVRFTIEPGMAARTIGKELQRFGLIRDPELFEAYVRLNALDEKIQAGTYVLDPSMSLREVVEAIQHAESESVSVTIL